MQKKINAINVQGVKIKSIRKVGKADVYNIQMKKNHNYFANDINISNCDALRYIVNTVIKSNATWLNSKKEEVNLEDVREKAKDIQQIQEQQSAGQYEGQEIGRRNFTTF